MDGSCAWGAETGFEPDYFRSRGVRDVVGIDLFSECPDVVVMDMHEMTFPPGSFDVVYSSHSLEHSIEPKRAIKEFARVLKPGGVVVIEVPTNYDPQTTGADLHDFRTPERIVGLFADFSPRVLWQQTDLPLDAGTDVIRTVIRLKESATE